MTLLMVVAASLLVVGIVWAAASPAAGADRRGTACVTDDFGRTSPRPLLASTCAAGYRADTQMFASLTLLVSLVLLSDAAIGTDARRLRKAGLKGYDL